MLCRTVFRSVTLSLKCQRVLFSSDASFDAAVKAVKNLPREPSNEDKLKLYALYKQATVGKNTSKKPGMFDVTGKFKWDAWSALGDMSEEEAKRNYISLVEKLREKFGSSGRTVDKSASNEGNSIEGLEVTFKGGILTFRLNNPRRRNPLTIEMYKSITTKLREAASDEKCRVAVLTGTGDYYSSGNDLKNFEKMMSSVSSGTTSTENLIAASAELGRTVLSDFQEALINFPKPMIALVNGPAVGIAVTTLGLCDAVLASEKATFSTPFTTLGMSPEGCSSLTFPLLMGPLVANDVLMFGRVLTAKEAEEKGLVSRVIPADHFESICMSFLKHTASLPPGSLQASKRLIRGSSGQPLSRAILLAVSREECEVLARQWQSEECIKAIANFWSRKPA